MNESIKKYLSRIGKIGGSAVGGSKAEASRRNGKLGGRPKRDSKTQEIRPENRKS